MKIKTVPALMVIVLALTGCEFFLPQDDTDEPKAVITNPAEGSRVSDSVIIRASATDDIGVFKVVFKIDGIVLGSDYDSPYEIQWSLDKATLGEHNIEAIAYDDTGNIGRSSIIHITVVRETGDSSFTFSEDFNAYSEGVVGIQDGQLLSDSWLASGLENSWLEIGRAPGGALTDRALHFIDGMEAGDVCLAQATFSPMISGEFSFRIYFEEASYLMISLEKKSSGEDFVYAFSLGCEIEAGSGDIVLTYTHDGTSYNNGTVISLNSWHEIGGVFDCEDGTYKLLFDGTEVDKGLKFSDSNADVVNNLGFMTLYTTGGGGNFWVDDTALEEAEVDTGPTETGLPQTPVDLTLTKNSNTSVTIGWTDMSGNEAGFDIYRYMASEGMSTMALINSPGPTVGSNVTSYIDTGLTAGETYIYMVKSWNSTGSSDDFIFDYITLLNVPAGMLATDGGSGERIDLSWDSVENADRYHLYRTEDPDGEWTHFGVLDGEYSGTWNSTTEPAGYEITPGTHYYYRVAAVDWISSSEYYETPASGYDEGWADDEGAGYDDTVPADFVMKYRYTTTGVGVYPVAITIDPDGTGVKEIETQVSRNFSYDPDLVQELYDLCLEKDIFRESWSPNEGRIPLGASESYVITVGDQSYGISTYFGLTEEESGAREAVIEFFNRIVTLPAPTGLTASDGTSFSIFLNWNNVEGAEHYSIYSCDTFDGEYEYICSEASSAAVLSDISDQNLHYFKVAAVDIVGWKSELSDYDSGWCSLVRTPLY